MRTTKESKPTDWTAYAVSPLFCLCISTVSRYKQENVRRFLSEQYYRGRVSCQQILAAPKTEIFSFETLLEGVLLILRSGLSMSSIDSINGVLSEVPHVVGAFARGGVLLYVHGRLQVNFLALDFDLTILDIHTSGRWPGTPEQLVQRIRPFFQVLIPVALAQGE